MAYLARYYLIMPHFTESHLFRKLQDLTRKRAELMPLVALWKTVHGLPVRDPQRERQLLKHLCHRAVKNGVNPGLVRGFFLEQMHLARQIQSRCSGVVPEQAEARHSIPDLRRVLRPQIRHITSEMFRVLVQITREFPESTEGYPDCPLVRALMDALPDLTDGSAQLIYNSDDGTCAQCDKIRKD